MNIFMKFKAKVMLMLNWQISFFIEWDYDVMFLMMRRIEKWAQTTPLIGWKVPDSWMAFKFQQMLCFIVKGGEFTFQKMTKPAMGSKNARCCTKNHEEQLVKGRY